MYTSCDQLFCRMLFLTFIIKCIMYKARKTLKWMRKLHYKHQIPSLPNIMKQFLPLKKSPFFLSWPVFVISFSISENEVIPHSFSLTGKYSRRHALCAKNAHKVFACLLIFIELLEMLHLTLKKTTHCFLYAPLL